MARGDIKLRSQLTDEFSKQFGVASGGAATIPAGTPVKGTDAAAASPWLGVVVPMVDGDGSTAQRFIGVSKSDSTDTAAAAGVVVTWMPLPGLIYEAKAKTASNANTAALIEALKGKRVVFDLTASVWTIDTAAADAVANCVVCVGGEYQTQVIQFMYASHGTWLNFSISA